MFFKFVLKELIKGKLRPSTAETSPVIRGLRFYNSIETGKKSLKEVYAECKKLYNYWDCCWPDTYFRFAMFMKGFGDERKMKSFIPQEAYYHYSRQSKQDAKYNILIDDKILCHDLLSYYGFPVPERFFVFRNNEFRKKDKVLTNDEVDSLLTSVQDSRIFVKYFTGGAASGISILQRVDIKDCNRGGGIKMIVAETLQQQPYEKSGVINL